MGLPPAAFGREREDRSPYPMFQATVDFAYDQYLGISGPRASTFYTVPFTTSPDYIGVTQAATTALCTNHLQPVMVTPSRRESKSSRMRKSRHPTSTDHVKHRRTRSGCLTCRRRRVKCDEAHPQCERCRKGGRECIFPSDVSKKANASQSAKSGSHSPDREHSALATLSDLDEESEAGDSPTEPFEPTSDHKYNEHTLTRGRSHYSQSPHGRSVSETPSCDSLRSSDVSEISTTDTVDAQRPQRLLRADHYNEGNSVDERLGFYLSYFSSHITYSDYGLVCDPDNFFESTLPQMATLDGNHALLYGVAAFSAYRYALRHSHGCLEDFLEFYNESVTSVLQKLKGNEEPTVATLITLLQLNAIEANFSDFSQLVSHHRAASELIPGVCKPEMLEDASVRAALSWYLHYDNIMSTLCEIKPQLPRLFAVSLAHVYHEKANSSPQHDSWKLAESHVQLCLIIYDAADCRPQRDYGSGLPARLPDDHSGIQERFYAWHRNLDPTTFGTQYLTLDCFGLGSAGGSAPLSTLRYMPDISTEPQFEKMLILAYWHFNVLLYEGTECLSRGMQLSEQLVEHAIRICQIWSLARSRSAWGSCTSLIVPLRTAILFLPRNGDYSQWIRESLAGSEALGMIMARPLRACMANILHDQTCLHWWMPHDENMSTTVLSARVMADERWASSATHSSLLASATMATPTSTATDSMVTSIHHTSQGHNILLEISDAISRLGSLSGNFYPEAPLEQPRIT